MRFPWQKKENPADRSIIMLYPGGQPIWTPKRYDKLAKAAYQKLDCVFACVDKIREAFAGLRWLGSQVDTKGDAQELDRTHELMRLLRRPNPRQGTGRFMGEAISYLLLAGNSYISKAGPKVGAPRELYNLRPDRMTVIPGTAVEPIRGYEYKAGNVPVPFGPAEILHLKEFHPTDDWYGLSRLEVAGQNVDVLNMAARWNAKLLDNDARPAGILKTSGNLTDEQFDRIKKGVKEQITGADNAGTPIGPLEGGLEWQQLSLSPKEMDWKGLDRSERLKICSIFNVPPEIIGDQENKTYSNYQEARRAFYLDNILQKADWIADELNYWLAPLFGENILIGYDRDAIDAVRDDRSKLITDMCSLVDRGIITRDDAAAQLGFEERGGVSAVPTVTGTVMPLEAAFGDPGTVTDEDTSKLGKEDEEDPDKAKEKPVEGQE